MNPFNWLRIKMSRDEKALDSLGDISKQAINQLMALGRDRPVSPAEAYTLYNTISPLGDAVDMIAAKFAAIDPIIVNSERQPVKGVEDAVNLLRKPNDLESYSQFATGMGTNFLLNRNSYIEAIGFFKAKPKEMYNVPNNRISLTEGSNNITYLINMTGFLHFLTITCKMTTEVSRALDSTNTREIFHYKGYDQSSSMFASVSKIQSILRDVEVVRGSLTHEASALKRGLSARGIMSIDTDNKEAFEQFKKDIEAHQSGAGNSGKTLFTMGKQLDHKKIDQNNRDMQLLQNKQDSRQAIYDRMDIPKPLVNMDAQTYNNYQTSLYALYDNAILPLAKTLYEGLTRSFQNRGMLSEDQMITFDERSIPALQLRRNEELKILNEIGVLSPDEIRTQAGYEMVGGAAGSIYIDSNKVPIGEDKFTDDNLDKPRKKKFQAMLEGFGADDDEVKQHWAEFKAIR